MRPSAHASTSLLSAALTILAACQAPHALEEAPPAERGSVVDILHGFEVAEPYRWMEDTDGGPGE